ncbi:hypothetical protein EYM_06615 [Ignicoccus islandicus DSM 13165]|uniref:SAM-dependent MTase RsmB/NOP-type domain-containing protein n=1 Tax=Ignicoccus islandicus DSM 13165 TaxID=940295 RepID=A0A0U3EBJ8_9CREN|nr:hypothetical protein [Ignicoccus islandicus]ALU12702.1 hypothetical protein EYM_06615 [Ignicoccus islandicus DSM 13165]
MDRKNSRGSSEIVPLELVAARALSRAFKGWNMKGYLERTYAKLGIPDKARPVIVGLIGGTARNWMVLSKALGMPYDKPRPSTSYWLNLVLAYQALFRRVPADRLEWAFKKFPRGTYLELLKSEPEDFLRDLTGEERERVHLSVPKWVWEEVKRVSDPKRFVEALDKRKGFWVRVRDPSIIPYLRRKFLIREGPFEDSLYLVGPKRDLIREKLHPNKVVIMELASMSIAYLAKGKRVLDLTSAPGGKAFHLKDKGFLVIANDIDPTRFYFPVERVVSDARFPPFIKAFDTIILDPDCSSIGRLNSPETRILLPVVNKRKLSAYQRELIKGMLKLVRKGTRLVYSTCTVTYEENEAHSPVLEEVAEPIDVDIALPRGRKGWRHYLPDVHETIGFTFAVFEVTS